MQPCSRCISVMNELGLEDVFLDVEGDTENETTTIYC